MRQTLVSTIIAALVAAGVSYASIRGDFFRRSSDVPTVVGSTLDTARTALDLAGLLMVVAEDREDTAAIPGQIVAQRPLPGSKLRAGEAVSVIVAKAPTLVKVPGVVGQLLGEARTRLEKARLSVSNVVEQTHPSLGVGMVIAQSVPEGAEVRGGTGVELKVSKGADAITVPAVTGKSLSKAKELLIQAGFTLGQIRYADNEDRSAGVVLEQKPAAKETLGKGLPVDLVVNSD
jgi:eukaryotic-like serine/threonine-protein kinase